MASISITGPNIAAVLSAKGERLKTITRPVPSPSQGQILVRARAIACNPIDWKIQEWSLFMTRYPIVLGADVAGEVVAVGPDITRLSVGDRVTGYAGVYYTQDIDQGAWQTYSLLPELATCKLPTSMTFEQAASFPMGMAAAAVALFNVLQLPRAPVAKESSNGLLVWGAASSVGASAVQIAALSGWKVIATASPQHHKWLRRLGATAIFDYRDPDVVDKIRRASKASGLVLRKAVDSISEESTIRLVAAALEAAGCDGGCIATMVPRPVGEAVPEGVEISLTGASRHGTDLKELGRWFFTEWLEKHLADGSVIAAPEIEIVEGGIRAAQKVFDLLKAGVSGKKLVVSVA